MDGPFVVRQRNEQRLVPDQRKSEIRGRVEIRDEDEGAVLLPVRLQVFEQIRRPRTLLPHPRLLVRDAQLALPRAHGFGESVERVDVAEALHRKAPDAKFAHPFFARRVVVLPGHVIERAGGQHFHLQVLGEPLRHHPAEELRSTVHLQAAALHDESDAAAHPGGSAAAAASSSVSRRASRTVRDGCHPSLRSFPGSPIKLGISAARSRSRSTSIPALTPASSSISSSKLRIVRPSPLHTLYTWPGSPRRTSNRYDCATSSTWEKSRTTLRSPTFRTPGARLRRMASTWRAKDGTTKCGACPAPMWLNGRTPMTARPVARWNWNPATSAATFEAAYGLNGCSGSSSVARTPTASAP